MARRFVTPPNWPSSPANWRPPTGWQPDPRWGPAPAGWQFWQEERGGWLRRHKVAVAVAAVPLAFVIGLVGASGSHSDDGMTASPLVGGDLAASSPSATAEPSAAPQASTDAEAARAEAARAKAARQASAARAKAEAARVKAAKAEAARVKAAKAEAAKIKAAKAKAAKLEAARKKAAKVKAAKVKAAKARAEAEAARERAEREAAEAAEASTSCTPGYSPCLEPASDYDCAGGSGNGPAYTGRVEVSGDDPYDLDADGDGVGCDQS